VNGFAKYLVVGSAALSLLMAAGCTATNSAFVSKASAATFTQTQANVAQEDVEADDAAEGADVPIIGSALDQARAAALAYVGEGKVTDSEVGDEEGYYEIEVTLDNGSQVDVHLDENFNVFSQVIDKGQDED
jgi:hypothetical protein